MSNPLMIEKSKNNVFGYEFLKVISTLFSTLKFYMKEKRSTIGPGTKRFSISSAFRKV